MTNTEAQAYAVLALKRLGFDRETRETVEREMYHLFDRITEEEAVELAWGTKRAGQPKDDMDDEAGTLAAADPFLIWQEKAGCECCGSRNDVAAITIVDFEISMCQGCRVTWWSKSKQASKAAKLDKQAVIQLVNETA